MNLRVTAVLVGMIALSFGCKRSEDAAPPHNTNLLTLMTTNVAPSGVVTNFPVRELGSLRFEIPTGWVAVSHESPTNLVPATTILFTIGTSRDFAMEFTALLGGKNLAKLDTQAATAEALRHSGTNALEKRIDISALTGPEFSGHYFSITDKSLVDRMPPPGEYKYMMQGTAKIAKFAVSFTIVSNDPKGEDRRAALEMLRNIRFIVR